MSVLAQAEDDRYLRMGRVCDQRRWGWQNLERSCESSVLSAGISADEDVEQEAACAEAAHRAMR